jgi:hypothetical protein
VQPEFRTAERPTRGRPKGKNTADVLDQIGWHKQIRVRDFTTDGKAREYVTDADCPGAGRDPELIDKEN